MEKDKSILKIKDLFKRLNNQKFLIESEQFKKKLRLTINLG